MKYACNLSWNFQLLFYTVVLIFILVVSQGEHLRLVKDKIKA
jgi:hypothetical protein